jgi:hypothetical protein
MMYFGNLYVIVINFKHCSMSCFEGYAVYYSLSEISVCDIIVVVK